MCIVQRQNILLYLGKKDLGSIPNAQDKLIMILFITKYNLSPKWIQLLVLLLFYFICIKLHYSDLDSNVVECMQRSNKNNKLNVVADIDKRLEGIASSAYSGQSIVNSINDTYTRIWPLQTEDILWLSSIKKSTVIGRLDPEGLHSIITESRQLISKLHDDLSLLKRENEHLYAQQQEVLFNLNEKLANKTNKLEATEAELANFRQISFLEYREKIRKIINSYLETTNIETAREIQELRHVLELQQAKAQNLLSQQTQTNETFISAIEQEIQIRKMQQDFAIVLETKQNQHTEALNQVRQNAINETLDIINKSNISREAKQEVTQHVTNVITYQPTHTMTIHDNSNNGIISGSNFNSPGASQDGAQMAFGSHNNLSNRTFGDRTINCFTQTCQHMSQCCGDVTLEIRKCLGLT